ncbi:MAG: endopeptidase La [Myxococcales bacterium]|nr:endopeptidase La [Myxococcales bacterium]
MDRDDLPREIPPLLPVLPLRDTVIFPLTVTSIAVGQPRSLQLVEDVQRTNRLLALLAQKEAEKIPAGPMDLHRVGTAAVVQHSLRGPDGVLRVIVQGLERIRLGEVVRQEPYLVARVERYPEERAFGLEAEALQRAVRELFAQVLERTSPELAATAQSAGTGLQLIYLIASSYPFATGERQAVIEEPSELGMLRRLHGLLQHESAVSEIKERLATQTREKLTKGQREYILREQLQAIRKELGELESEEGDLRELSEQLSKAGLPEEAKKEADRELERLRRVPPASPEHGVIRSYLEWLRDLPWNRPTGARIDVGRAREVLDADHHDLERVKERILEYLAVKKLRDERGVRIGETPLPPRRGEVRGEPILCLVGPPGVGKTSLGQSIARALERKFTRMSLGGIHDEAEIRGHRRTYIGAMPGRILQALRRVETSDPIFMLDEVDKLQVGFHGDPSAALLEVLDPAQNHAFVDTYLGVPFDLSRVLFICTANNMESIPAALLDRMEVIRLPGYTDEEKLHIARKYVLPNLLAAHGLEDGEVVVGDPALRQMIRDYTREAGVRNLERALADVIRKVAKQVSEGARPPLEARAEALRQYLGPPRFFDEVSERIDRPGVSTGLAWTPAGGEVLFIEAAMMEGREEELILTGMLGDVMRESARAALSYLRSSAPRFGIDARYFRRKSVHLHVPAGAIPKDGPSAGLPMVVALTSLVTRRIVDSAAAMTGEITLRGKVLPVGGIKEKVLAAHRAGLRRVILPRRNEGSLEDVPEEVKRALRFVFVDSIDEALADALGLHPLYAGVPEEIAPATRH